MGQLTAVDPQNSCRFYRVNLFTNAISRFTTISMNLLLKKQWVSGWSYKRFKDCLKQ